MLQEQHKMEYAPTQTLTALVRPLWDHTSSADEYQATNGTLVRPHGQAGTARGGTDNIS
jgi:hypothetical protein